MRKQGQGRCGEVGRASRFAFHVPPCTPCAQPSRKADTGPTSGPFAPPRGAALSGFHLGLKGHGLLLCLQLFLDDSKMKNFITCFKDPQFLVFFFSRLRPNRSGRYETSFPFLSPCGRERNFLRCEDRPVVFTHLLAAGPEPPRLSYCGGGEALTVPFEPARLLPLAANGRLYHPAPERAGGVGLVRSALAFELSACFEYAPGAPELPSHVRWQGCRFALTMDLAPLLPAAPPR
uniref:Uncharacterized protein n=1 Tax=Sus scrofa TaxID=9823 RepID=A0A8D1RWT0_PIG